MFSGDDSNYINIEEHIFIKENDGILCIDKLDDHFINDVNSIYSDDIKKIIEKSRKEMSF